MSGLMSDLERLGGLEAAEKRCDNLSEVGFYTAEKLMRALVARVKELERELNGCRKVLESARKGYKDVQDNRVAPLKANLQSARELAEMVERYYGSLQRHSVASKRILAKASEFLEDK